MRRWGCGLLALAMLAACGRTEHKAAMKLNTFDVAEPAPADQAAPTSRPQIAYTYALSYDLPGSAVAGVQARQVAICRTLGAGRCIVAKTDLVRDDAAGDVTASTKLLVEARAAGGFLQRLDAEVGGAGGSVSGRHVTAEDVTKQIVDTDARVRAKQALADRLTQLIQSGNGKVADLVDAEKAFADVQEALDAARGEQAALRQRVALSEIDLDYGSAAATGTWSPVRRAFRDLGQTFAASVGGLVAFVAAALPWALLLAFVLWLLRRVGWRWRFWRRRAAPSAIESTGRIG